jgi:hypothetical protein
MDHTTTLAGGCPILALDMYEHSYHMDYGARAAAYVDTFMAVMRYVGDLEAVKRRANGTTASLSPPMMSSSTGNTPLTRQRPPRRSAATRT